MRLPLVIIVVAAFSTPIAWAQPTEPEPPFPVHEVKLQKKPNLAPTGTVALYEGTVDEIGLGYRLSNTSMLMPVSVTVASLSNVGVRVTIGKSWTDAERTFEATGDKVVTERYRTDDVSQIKVASMSKDTARFVLMIWVGDERTDYHDVTSPLDLGQPERVRVGASGSTSPTGGSGSSTKPPEAPAPPAAPAHTPSSPASTGGESGSPVLWIIAGLLGVIVILGVVALRRRK